MIFRVFFRVLGFFGDWHEKPPWFWGKTSVVLDLMLPLSKQTEAFLP
jgi:hypothetical protein